MWMNASKLTIAINFVTIRKEVIPADAVKAIIWMLAERTVMVSLFIHELHLRDNNNRATKLLGAFNVNEFWIDSKNNFILDIDECASPFHGCAQLCNNTIGGYFCTCAKGYNMTTNNRTCESKWNFKPLRIWECN